MLNALTAGQSELADEPVEARADTGATRTAADSAETVAAVDWDIEMAAAVRTDNAYK